MTFVPIPNVTTVPMHGEYAWPVLQYGHVATTTGVVRHLQALNTHNRRKRGSHVATMARKAKEKLLLPSLIPVAHVGEARIMALMDLQHYLDGIELADRGPVDCFLVVFDVPTWKEHARLFAQFNVDDKRRQLEDFVWLALGRLNLDLPVLYYTKIARGIAYYKHGGRYTDNKLSVADRAELLIDFPRHRNRLWSRFYSEGRGPADHTLRSKLCRPALMAAYLEGAKAAQCTRACWEEFWDELLKGDLSPGRQSPGRKLRRLLQLSDVGGGKPAKRAKYRLSNEQFFHTSLHMAECHGAGRYNAPVRIVPNYGDE